MSRGIRGGWAVVAVVALIGVGAPAAGAAAGSGGRATRVASVSVSANPYADAKFSTRTNSYTFGQAPIWMPDNKVLFNQDFGKGAGQQIYTSTMAGTSLRCLTCGQPAPNGVPALRPGGGWILYHSWQGHKITFGAPGMGGIGSELWIMRTDGTDRTQLTGLDTKGPGSSEGTDDYHAYWSPDGRHIEWAHLGGNVLFGGSQKWDIRVATVDFTPKPHLVDERVVVPANSGWKETQWWAPNGKGFLYTETVGSTLNTELFYCRLTSKGCVSTRYTHSTGWDEQATFTPDMKDVIFMSTRDHPGFYNTFSQAMALAGLGNQLDYLLVLPIFEASFEQPVAQEATDLYELNLHNGSVRRLTHDGDDGWIIPEFCWNPSHTALMWVENRYQDGERVGTPVDLARQLKQEQALLDSGALTNANLSNILAPLPIQQRTRIGTFDVR